MSNKSFLRLQRALRRSSTLTGFRPSQNKQSFNQRLNITRPKTGNKYNNINNIKKIEDKKRNKSLDEKESENAKEKEEMLIFNKFNNEEIKNRMSAKNNYNEMKKIARNKWMSENIQLKEFKKIKESRNKDKILKIHNQQYLVKCLNEFNRLIKHTNKLFVYKYKISPKDLRNINRQNMASKYLLSKKRIIKSKSMEELKTDNKIELKMEKDNVLSNNIEHKIDALIKSLQGEKLKFIYPVNSSSQNQD